MSSFNFMAAASICRDFRAHKNKVPRHGTICHDCRRAGDREGGGMDQRNVDIQYLISQSLLGDVWQTVWLSTQ